MYRRRRDFQCCRRLVIRQATKKQQLDQFALPLIVCGEPGEGLVQLDNSSSGSGPDHDGLIERNFLSAAPAFLPVVRLGMVHQNPSQ
jgi:hypothetical protein